MNCLGNFAAEVVTPDIIYLLKRFTSCSCLTGRRNDTLFCKCSDQGKYGTNGSGNLKLLPDEELLGLGKDLAVEEFTCPNAT